MRLLTRVSGARIYIEILRGFRTWGLSLAVRIPEFAFFCIQHAKRQEESNVDKGSRLLHREVVHVDVRILAPGVSHPSSTSWVISKQFQTYSMPANPSGTALDPKWEMQLSAEAEAFEYIEAESNLVRRHH